MHKSSDTPKYCEDTDRDIQAPRRHVADAGAKRFPHTLHGVGGDRRRQARRKFRADVMVVPFDADLPRCCTTTEDISRRGMFIISSHQYPLGTLLWLTLETEHGDLELAGKVVHLLEGIGFGCEFFDLSEDQREALSFLVATSRPRRPRTTSRVQ